MEAHRKRHIRDGLQYDHLFPRANVDTHTITRHAGVDDTVGFIQKVVAKTLGHTKKIAQHLKGRTDFETCERIWHFVYNHIDYQKDRDGYEQVRSPARSWHDRKTGVDCDCYTTFISSILSNLKIAHKLRITKYHKDYFQHIYPVAMLGNKEVVIDCVTDKFNYEVPYSEKKDFHMDLQYLDGIDMEQVTGYDSLDYVHDEYGTDGLGRAHKHKEKKKNKHKNAPEAFEHFMDDGDQIPAYGVKKKKGVKKLFNFVNKLNPATLALRNGVLAAMKLNIGQIAKRMRWSYLTPNEAKKKGMDMERWKHLVQVRQKLDNIFYGAGGKPENMKKAILKGKGNKDKALHGLGISPHHYDFDHHHATEQMSVHTPLRQLLGDDIFHSENEGVHGLGELGEPVTMATVAAASGVIAAIVKMLKKVGDVFKGKSEHSADFTSDEAQNAEKDIPASKDGGPGSGSDDDSSGGSPKSKDRNKSKGDGNVSDNGSDGDRDSSGDSPKGKNNLLPAKSTSTDLSVDKDDSSGGKSSGGDDKEKEKDRDKDPDDKETFWSKHKKWLLPTSIGVGGITLLAVGIHAMKGHTPAKPAAKSQQKPVHGVPNGHHAHHAKKNHHRKAKAKSKAKKVKAVKW